MSRVTPISNQGVLVATPQSPWKILRAAAPEDSAAALTLSLSHEYTAIATSAALVDLQALFGNTFQKMELAFYSTTYGEEDAADGDKGSIEIYGLAQDMGNGANMPMMLAYTAAGGMVVGTCTTPEALGTGLWFDSITLGSLTSPFGALVHDHATNRAAGIYFSTCGIRYLYFNVFGVLGVTEATEAPSMGIIGRVW